MWRARDLETGLSVALKVLKRNSPGARARFEREAQVLHALAHPSIVEYISHGAMPDGRLWIATEWVDGPDLWEVLRPGPMSWTDAARMGAGVAGALAALHRDGVVHRDIKPGNLLLPNGDPASVKVLDLGLAHVRDAPLITAVGVTIGTPGYMAPEQVRGEITIDPAADVFSLGCVIYESLFGERAFGGSHTMAVLVRCLFDPVALPSRGLPARLVDLLERMFVKQAAERPSAEEVQEELLGLSRDLRVALAAPVPREATTLTSQEVRVVSVILVSDARVLDPEAPTLHTTESSGLVQAGGDLTGLAARFGARVERLPDGSVVAILAGLSTPRERALSAAHCALALRGHFPKLAVVLSTGWGVAGGALPVGPAVDHAIELLPAAPRTGVRIDPGTARVLGPEFELQKDAGGLVLVGTRRAQATSVRPAPCFGREKEIATLQAALSRVRARRRSQGFLVTAESGMGKTSLIQAFLTGLTDSDVQILRTWGDPQETAPYAMAGRAILRAAGIQHGEVIDVRRTKLLARVDQVLPESERQWVADFLGELAGVPMREEESEPLRVARADPQLKARRMRAAWAAWLRAEAAQRPTVLVMDDVHWADRSSVELLRASLGTVEWSRLLLVASSRPIDGDELLAGLQEVMTPLKLGPLSLEAGAELVKARLGDATSDGEIQRLLELSRGHPYLLDELTSDRRPDAAGGVPRTIVEVVQSRLDRLRKAERQVLRAASIFGANFWQGGVAELVGPVVEGQPLEECLESLIERGFIVPRPEAAFPGERELSFRHDIVREAVAATLTIADRRVAHRLAGGWLQARGARDAVVLANHFEQGGQPDSAVVWYLRAGREALASDDLARAEALARRGIACGAGDEVLGALHLVAAEACLWRSELLAAEQHAKDAARLLEGDEDRWCRSVVLLLISAVWLGHDEVVATWLGRLANPGDPDHRSGALCRIAGFLAVDGRPELAQEALSAAERAGGVAGAPLTLALQRRALAYLNLHDGDLGAVPSALAEASTAFEDVGDLRNAWMERVNRGYVFILLGRYEEAVSTLRDAQKVTERIGLVGVVGIALHNHGYALVRLKRLDEGLALLERAVAHYERHGDLRFAGASRMYLSDALRGLGKDREAERECRHAEETLAGFPGLRALARARLSRLRLECGDALGAIDFAELAVAVLAQRHMDEAGLIRLVHAQALAAAGRASEATEAYRSAATALRDRAARIVDLDSRTSFLEAVAEHALTLELSD